MYLAQLLFNISSDIVLDMEMNKCCNMTSYIFHIHDTDIQTNRFIFNEDILYKFQPI